MLTPNVALSLEGRFQYIPQDPKYSRFAAHGAISGLVKLMRYTKQSQLRFFGTALAGGGEGFRFVVKPGSGITDPDRIRCTPSATSRTPSRPVRWIAGLGGGLYFEATKRAAIVAEVHALAGFPTFGVVVDGNVALQINFYSETEAATPGRYVPKEEDEEPK